MSLLTDLDGLPEVRTMKLVWPKDYLDANGDYCCDLRGPHHVCWFAPLPTLWQRFLGLFKTGDRK